MSAYPATTKGVSYHATDFLAMISKESHFFLLGCHISSLVTPIASHSLAILICPAKVGRRMVTRKWMDFLQKGRCNSFNGTERPVSKRASAPSFSISLMVFSSIH